MSEPRIPVGIPAAVLAVAPLALDAVAGCGGTLSRLAAQGARVHYVVVFDCAALLERTQRACRILGIGPGDLHCLRLDAADRAERARLRLRQDLVRILAEVEPSVAFVPSLHSVDPGDAWVAREAAEALRGRNILAYDRLSGPVHSSRPVVITLNTLQASAKTRAMRPRRLRPGCAVAAHSPALETFELVEWRPELPVPVAEIHASALTLR